MGLMDKVKFWKHEPDMNLDPSLDLGPDLTPMDQGFGPNAGLPPQQYPSSPIPPQPDPVFAPDSMAPPRIDYERPRVIEQPQQLRQDSNDKNLEIISMKLDNIKVAIESLSQRVANIERLARDSQRQPPRRPQW